MRKNTTAIAILFIILFLVMVGFGIVIPIMPLFITHLGGGPTTFRFPRWNLQYTPLPWAELPMR